MRDSKVEVEKSRERQRLDEHLSMNSLQPMLRSISRVLLPPTR